MKKINSTVINLLLGGLFGAFLGVMILSFIPKEKLLNSLITLVIAIYPVSMLSIIIHEGGHLIVGLLTGYKFISFRIGKKIILKHDNHFILKTYHVAGTAGQCLLKPPVYSQDFPYFWYNIGGGLFNLLVALFSYLIISSFKINFSITIILFIIIFINIYFAIMNLVPLKLSVPNDGYNLYMMLKEKNSRFGLYSQMMIYNLITEQTAYQDIDPVLFKLPENANLNNPLNQSILINQVALLHNQYKFDEASSLINKIKQNCNLCELFKNELNCEALFYLIYKDPNNPLISKLYQTNANYIKLTAKTSLERQRLLYAYKKLVKNDELEATEHLQQFNKIAANYPFKITIDCETNIIKLIDKL